MTDYQFLDHCNYFHVGIVKTINMIKDTQSNTSSCILLIIPIKTPTQETEPNFLEIEFLSDTGATICILNTQTWNAMKIDLSPSLYEPKQDVDTKLGTAKSQVETN